MKPGKDDGDYQLYLQKSVNNSDTYSVTNTPKEKTGRLVEQGLLTF